MKEGGEGTAQEIAKAAKIRREDALAALSALEEQGQVDSDMRQTGGKGRPKRIYFVPKAGNKNTKESDGNKNAVPLEPAKIKGESDSIFVPPAWNLAGTKIDPTKPTIDRGSSDIRDFCSHNLFSKGEDGNENPDDFYGSAGFNWETGEQEEEG